MSRALAKAALLKPEIRLAQVISEFEADLSNEQKASFRMLRMQSLSTTPSPDDVMRLTAEVDRCTSKKFARACFGPRFTNFLHGVQQFAALGDVLVGGTQSLIACGVWSLVRMSLLSIVNLTTYVDKLSSVFMDVGRSAPHHQAIALLYPQSANLQSYLNEYFIVVVGLCHYLFKFGQKSTVQQFTSSLSDSHLMTFQADLDKWANMIKGQMLVNEAQESHGYRDYTKAMLKSTSDQQRRAAKMRVLDFCSTYDHGKDLKQIRKAGNSSLHMRQGEYSAWRDSSYSCTLLCTGKLGSGKSVLLASIVENLSLHTKNDRLTILAYFFCKHDVPESLLARTVIGSLSRQLLCAVPKLDLAAESCESIHMRNTERVLEILLQWFPSGTKAYLVLDGLDECNKEEKETILQAVRTIQEMTTVLVCASSREEPNNGLQLIANQCLATRVVSMPADNPDIEAFIEADLKRRLREQRLTIGDPALILEIRDALLKGSQGMFLWVALQIESLCSIKTDYAIREALADLPKDLSETFARILKRSGSTDPALQAKTLQLVVAAYRPLTTDELREALSVTPGDATWDPSRLINNVYSVLAHCGCLLVVDEEELTVRVVHHSFKQYILNRVDGENSLKFSLTQAQRTLADIVVTYLGYGVFGTELSRAKVNPMVIQSAPSKIVQATMGSTSVTSRLATRFLESGKQPTIDLSRIIAEARNSFNSTSPFKLYSYAIAHWQKHIFYVSGNDSSIHELSSKLIHARRFELNGMSEDYLEHVRSAIRNGNKDILALLHEAWKFDVTPKGVGGWPPLILAASMGDSNIARVLLSVGEPDVNARTVDGRDRTALMLAVLGGHSETVEVLLTVGKADTEIKDDRGFTALMMATYTGNNNVVEILLTIGKANVEAKNDYGETALMLAADCGEADIAELLLRVGKADAEAKNKASVTALEKAMHYRCINTVKVLVILGKADIEARDRHGFTLLMLAVEREWAEGVDFLLGISTANIEAKDDKERTALMLAIQRGSTEVAELLINVGKADVEVRDNKGLTALLFAVQEGKPEVVKLLLNVGKADIWARDNEGRTVLMLAAQHWKSDTTMVLLEHGGADIEAKDKEGFTALLHAAQERYANVVNLLLSFGKADVEAKDNGGRTALMLAANTGRFEVVELLLRVGKADIKAKDGSGRTALEWAESENIYGRNGDVIELLQSYLDQDQSGISTGIANL